MTEQTASKVPQIRFMGFEGEWEERFLGELFTKIRNAFVGTATPYYTQKGYFYLQSNNIKNGQINRNTEIFINEEFYLKQKNNWLRSNDIVMVQSGHVGHAAVIPDELNNSAAHALIIISKPLRNTCPYYLNFYLQGNRARRDLANITTGNTIKHILASDIKKFGSYFTHYEEQTKIGDYFRELDSLIELHQRKHDKLVTLKKAMLQNMFPQPGATTPEIRFKGFEGDWEEIPIGDILSETKRSIVLEDNQQYELVTVKRRNGGVVSRGWLWGRDILVKNYAQLETGDFLISKRQVVHGATGIVPAELNGAIVSNEYLVAVSNSKISTNYFAILSSLPDMRQKFFLSSYGVDIEKLFFDAEDWKKRVITIPKLPEQNQIGSYFRTLDELISKHATQLQKLQQIKSACLEKMFV